MLRGDSNASGHGVRRLRGDVQLDSKRLFVSPIIGALCFRGKDTPTGGRSTILSSSGQLVLRQWEAVIITIRPFFLTHTLFSNPLSSIAT